MQRLTQTLDFQAQALTLRSERQRLLASNIANADTPGYVAREMDFASALRQAGGLDTGRLAMASSHAGHLDPGDGARDEAGLVFARGSQDAVDRNTVDLDRERASFADNSVRYEATLRFINSGVRNLLDAMKNPNQA